MQRGRGSRRRRNNNFQRRFVSHRQLHNSVYGVSPRGRFDPPRVISQPWNSVVLAVNTTFTTPGIYSATVENLCAPLRLTLGLPTVFDLLLRFSRVDVWTVPADVLLSTLNLALRPQDLTGGVRTTSYHWIEDTGTAARPAHCHFIWPASNRDFVLNSSADASDVIYEVDWPLESGAIFAHIHILWKGFNSDPIPATRSYLHMVNRNSFTSSGSSVVDVRRELSEAVQSLTLRD